MIKKLSFFICIFLLRNAPIIAQQENIFDYETELCKKKGFYSDKKYTREQLQNTLDYLVKGQYIDADATAFTQEGIKRLSLAAINQECADKLEKMNTLQFVNNPFWKQLKADRIKEIESTCRLSSYTLQAYENPQILLTYKPVDSISIYYRDALIAGGEKLLQAWGVLNEYMKSKNGRPDYLQKEYEAKLNSPHQLEYARINVMAYGWWNSAGELLFRADFSFDYEKAFEKLFTKVKSDCDEP